MLLLIPGPVTTRPEVRAAMTQDLAPWDNDFRTFLTTLRERVLRIAGGTADKHTVLPLQGCGHFITEAAIRTFIPQGGKLLMGDGQPHERVQVSRLMLQPRPILQETSDGVFIERGAGQVMRRQRARQAGGRPHGQRARSRQRSGRQQSRTVPEHLGGGAVVVDTQACGCSKQRIDSRYNAADLATILRLQERERPSAHGGVGEELAGQTQLDEGGAHGHAFL